MAQYPITNTCGHTYTYNLFGPNRDRRRKEDWLKTVVCPTCKWGRTASTTPARRCECASGQMGGACTCC